MSKPTPELFAAGLRVLSYLYRHRDVGIRYRASEAPLVGRSDSNWAVKHSTTGFVFKFSEACISWGSKKQKSVSLSSCEAELMAGSEAAKEALSLRSFLEELGFGDLSPTELGMDNQAAIAISYNPEHHSRTKHIDRRHFFIRECVENHQIRVPFVPTAENDADFFTKPLAAKEFFRLRDRIMNVPSTSTVVTDVDVSPGATSESEGTALTVKATREMYQHPGYSHLFVNAEVAEAELNLLATAAERVRVRQAAGLELSSADEVAASHYSSRGPVLRQFLVDERSKAQHGKAKLLRATSTGRPIPKPGGSSRGSRCGQQGGVRRLSRSARADEHCLATTGLRGQRGDACRLSRRACKRFLAATGSCGGRIMSNHLLQSSIMCYAPLGAWGGVDVRAGQGMPAAC